MSSRVVFCRIFTFVSQTAPSYCSVKPSQYPHHIIIILFCRLCRAKTDLFQTSEYSFLVHPLHVPDPSFSRPLVPAGIKQVRQLLRRHRKCCKCRIPAPPPTAHLPVIPEHVLAQIRRVPASPAHEPPHRQNYDTYENGK